MKIPCKRCITLAACKNKEKIDCSILAKDYISFLEKYEYEQYNYHMDYIKQYGKLFLHLKLEYTSDNEYRRKLKNIFPILDCIIIE